ncbi:Acg family FMN-binding oxidoreductase [Cryptosporangium sp. NPDC051539]|uniref:Acg family FMN-binding oxidoreductase n=1 Tax=Cryptosporangium sp. NPDC051539 TaxID=3363962 RepID=UPI0037A48ADF
MTDDARSAPAQPVTANSDADPLTVATLVARRAPSFLNTQPWRWRRTADAAELWLDRDRQLTGMDPDGRLATMSCGVALHHALTALRASGRGGIVHRPGTDAPADLVAVLRTGPPCEIDDRAFDALASRRTDRRPFSGTPPTTADLDPLREAAERHGAHLYVLTPRQVPAFARSLSEARLRERIGAVTAAELADWTDRPGGSGDGVAARRHDPRGLRSDDVGFSRTPWMALGESAHAGTVYVVLHTDGDRPADWLAAGEALSDVWLTLTERGLAASPLSEVVEVPAVRASMRQLIGGAGHPMIALRIGVPGGSAGPPTARRAAPDVIELSDDR